MARKRRLDVAENEALMNHFRSPRNVGEIPGADAIANQSNPVCGDSMRLFLKLEGGRVVDAKFKTFGCASSIAASSALTELIRGRSIEEAARLSTADIEKELGGLPPAKRHSAELVIEALKQALAARA